MSESHRIECIQSEDVRRQWHVIRPGIEKIVESRRDFWLPEDVFTSLVTGHAKLYIVYVGEAYEGFVVATLVNGYDGREFHLWCAYNQGDRHLLEDTQPEWREIAKEEGCRYITFFSARTGFGRRLKDLDYHEVHTMYRRALGD